MSGAVDAERSIETLLLVDDDPIIIELLRLFLADRGYEFLVANDGAGALTAAATQRPDLILLDVQMPGLDGFATCQQLKADPTTAHIPVVFITGGASAEDIEQAFVCGAADYVRKPLEKQELQVRINNQVLLLRARARQAQRVRETEKLVQLGELVGAMSHEIATPIGNSRLAIDMLKRSFAEISRTKQERRLTERALIQFLEQGSEAVDIADHALEFASQLLQGFKVVAVDQCADREYTIRLRDYIERVLLSLRHKLKRSKVKVTIDGPGELEISTNPGAIAQIITNLVSNSLIHGFPEQRAGEIRISFSAADGSLQLDYRDDGVGIAAEHLPHVTEAYFTTRAGSGGSGLGMSIVHGLVTDRLGGTLQCSSTPGHGVLFQIRMPLRAASRT